MIKYLESDNFKDVIKEGIWLVDFYADWCGPCKMLSVVLEKVNCNVLKVNVDSHQKLASEFGVMSIPTMCFFKNGELKNKVIGFKSEEEINHCLKSLE